MDPWTHRRVEVALQAWKQHCRFILRSTEAQSLLVFFFQLGLQNPEHHSCQAAAPCHASLNFQVEEDLNSPGRDATEKATLGHWGLGINRSSSEGPPVSLESFEGAGPRL